jgi:hypothetical protein
MQAEVIIKRISTGIPYFCLLLMATLAGCRSNRGDDLAEQPKTWTVVENPTIRECQIIPKALPARDGQSLELLSSSEIDFKIPGRLLVAKYGSSNIIGCLDFYREVKTNAENQNHFVLLKHDYCMGMMVTSLSSAEDEGRAVVFIVRETVPGVKPRKGMRYALKYEKDYKISLDMEIGTWELPAPNRL